MASGDNRPSILITHKSAADRRAIYAECLGDASSLVYLEDCDESARDSALQNADAVISWNLREELTPEDCGKLERARFFQAQTAGVDHVPFSWLPDAIVCAGNGGVYAAPMAEHALTMALAATKRLIDEDRAMRAGEFNQFVPNRTLFGGTCAVLGYGGVGRAAAPLFRALGMRIHAVNRSGVTDDPVDAIDTIDNLENVLSQADVVLIALALTKRTDGLIGARELGWMKDDAILINVARGELVDEAALYTKLIEHPRFVACLEAWWVEPVRHGEFRLEHPFLELPNVIASPHNSASVPGVYEGAVRQGAENVRRWLVGEAPQALVSEEEKLN